MESGAVRCERAGVRLKPQTETGAPALAVSCERSIFFCAPFRRQFDTTTEAAPVPASHHQFTRGDHHRIGPRTLRERPSINRPELRTLSPRRPLQRRIRFFQHSTASPSNASNLPCDGRECLRFSFSSGTGVAQNQSPHFWQEISLAVTLCYARL